MARPSNKAQRRSQIARAMLTVMATKGYDAATIAEIAAEAGLNQGLIHYHFENKLEILVEGVAELRTHHLAQIEAWMADAEGDPLSQVDAFLDYHLGLGRSADPVLLAAWLVVSGEAARHPAVQEAFEGVLRESYDGLVHLIRRGNTFGVFRCPDPEAAACALLATTQGYYALAATARNLIPRGSAAPSAKRMARGLLGVAQ